MPADANVSKNPCGICRAMGKPSCSCSGGGGGDGDAPESSDAVENQDTLTLQNQPTSNEINELSYFLEESPDWKEHAEIDCLCSFEKFNDNAALSSIQLDLGNLKLVLNPKEELTQEAQEDLNFLFEKIKDEARKFGVEPSINKGSLEIKFTDMHDFDKFIKNLMQQNLIPTDTKDMQINNEVVHEARSAIDEPEREWQAPNPFDIYKGPTPPISDE